MKKFGFGTMRLPILNPEDPATIDYEQVSRMVDTYMEAGFTYFDTAYPYHQEMSEGAVKRCLVDRYPRESYILADKMPIIRVKDSSDYQRYFDEQLERCGVTYFDYYLLHNMGIDRYVSTEKYGGFQFISELKKKGLAKNIGFSFHDNAAVLDKILTEHPEVDFVQLQLNYLDWKSEVVQSEKCYEVATKHGKKIIVMEPVKGGVLADVGAEAQALLDANTVMKGHVASEVSAASYAIRFAASLDNVMLVLSGMSNEAQLRDNISYMKDFEPLTEDEIAMLHKCAELINGAMEVGCTSCKYCLEECPLNVNIPAYFGLLNLYKSLGKKTNMYYERASFGHAKAKECIKCGKCEKICPQHIAIREKLEKFSELYEK